MISRFGKIFFIAIIAFNVFLIFLLNDANCTLLFLFIIALWCLVYFLIYLVRKNITMKCKRCGAKGAMRYLGKQCVNERELRKLKETDSTGRRVQPYYVYGRELTYKEAKRCIHCGYTEYWTSEKEEWDDENIRN